MSSGIILALRGALSATQLTLSANISQHRAHCSLQLLSLLFLYGVNASVYISVSLPFALAHPPQFLTYDLAAGGLYGGKPQTQTCIMGLDALGGYVFARMAHNGGYDVCPYNVAAAAGAVYGVITGFFHTVLGCMAGCATYESTNGHYTVHNIFGKAEGYNENWIMDRHF